MALVVCRHTSAVFFRYPDNSLLTWFLNGISVLCIPLFFMVTGYLLIERREGYGYVCRKLLSIARLGVVFTLIVMVIKRIGNPLSIFSIGFVKDYVCQVYFSIFTAGYFWIFWYLWALGALYLLYPLLSRLAVEYGKSYALLLVFLGIVESVAVMVNLVSGGEFLIPQSLRIWNWLFYFMLGGAIKMWPNLRKVYSTRTLGGMAVVTGALFLVVRHLFVRFMPNTYYVEFFYGTPAVVVFSLFVFLWGISLNIKESRFVRCLSRLFLPVYALHPILLSVINPDTFSTVFCGPVLYFLVIFIATVLVSWGLMKLKPVRWVFKI